MPDLRAPERETQPDDRAQRFAGYGTGLLLLALIAVVTGIGLLPFYEATAEGAHRSVEAIRTSPVLGLVRAAHHWSSALLILCGGAYLLYGLFSGSYRRPLHLAWVAAAGLVLLFELLQLTGHLLPWDAAAVSMAAIEAGIAENVPVIGPVQGRLIRGGESISPRTLTTWYYAHVALFPAALAVLAGFFVVQLRRERLRLTLRSIPTALVLVLLLLATLTVEPPYGPPASPADYNSFAAPPEWYVLPLHGLLTLAQRVHPSLTFVGPFVIPGIALLLLLALPWLDRRTIGQAPSLRIRGLAGAAVVLLVVLAAANWAKRAPLYGPARPVMATTSERPPQEPSTPLDPALAQKGKALFEKQGCFGCHKLAGKGNAVGPALDQVGARRPSLDWQVRHLKTPAAVVPGSTMPPYNHLSEEQLRALAMYMISLR